MRVTSGITFACLKEPSHKIRFCSKMVVKDRSLWGQMMLDYKKYLTSPFNFRPAFKHPQQTTLNTDHSSFSLEDSYCWHQPTSNCHFLLSNVFHLLSEWSEFFFLLTFSFSLILTFQWWREKLQVYLIGRLLVLYFPHSIGKIEKSVSVGMMKQLE